METLVDKLKKDLIKNLTSNEQIADLDYLHAGTKTYTRREIAAEIENETEFGIDFLSGMVQLAIDLTARQKI